MPLNAVARSRLATLTTALVPALGGGFAADRVLAVRSHYGYANALWRGYPGPRGRLGRIVFAFPVVCR